MLKFLKENSVVTGGKEPAKQNVPYDNFILLMYGFEIHL